MICYPFTNDSRYKRLLRIFHYSLSINGNWIGRSFVKCPPHCMHKCVWLCVTSIPYPLPYFAERLLSVSCAIARWRFISSETSPFAWQDKNSPPHTYILKPQTHRHSTHTHTAGQYVSDGKVFSLPLTWLFFSAFIKGIYEFVLFFFKPNPQNTWCHLLSLSNEMN